MVFLPSIGQLSSTRRLSAGVPVAAAASSTLQQSRRQTCCKRLVVQLHVVAALCDLCGKIARDLTACGLHKLLPRVRQLSTKRPGSAWGLPMKVPAY
jgi:hypothetical protein